jgi:hypothetical protein
LDENDITLIYIPYKQGISSSEIKKLIKWKSLFAILAI